MEGGGHIVRRTIGGNATSFWMMGKTFRVRWVGRSSEKFLGTSGWRALNTALSVWVYAGVVKGYVVVSEDHRTKGNAAYSASPHHTLNDVRVRPAWRERERRGPKRVSRSEVIKNMKYCTYLICLRSCAGVDVDVDKSLRRGDGTKIPE